MPEKKIRPLTPKQRQGLATLARGKPVSTPRVGGVRVAEALVDRGFAVQGPMVPTSMTVTSKGTSMTLQPTYSITKAGLAELGLQAAS